MKRQNNILTCLLTEVNLLVHEAESLHCELKELKKWCSQGKMIVRLMQLSLQVLSVKYWLLLEALS